ncbi:hypothetical protein [Kitasatospora sp. NPDC059327]|uniref:SCO2583/SCO2584 N-terminal domain-containing protein n=1 Tax=Kitasatospora sp. NPDC059327 TaxID=3346803 RepID=UPI00369AC496
MPIAEDPEPRPSEDRAPDGASGADGKDPFADLVLDEEFIRGATVKEQAGRTRMLSARWQHTPPVDPGGRRSVNDGPRKAKRFGRAPKPVDPWGTPRRRRPQWRTALYVLLAVLLVLAAVNIDGLRSWYSTHLGDASDRPGSARTVAKPSATAALRPTVDHPWADSPAESWASGAAGIELPKAAQPTGTFSAEQVAAQLNLIRDYVSAANLDPKLIAGGSPDAALAMLDTVTLGTASRSLAHPSPVDDPSSWFTRFDPLEAIPVSTEVKVRGWISYEADGENGVRVKTDITYVYALRPGPEAARRAASPRPAAGPPAAVRPVGLVTPAADAAGDTWTTRTIVRRSDTFRFHDPAKYRVDPKKVSVELTVPSFGNSACGVSDGFLHPEFDQFPPVRPNPTGPTRDPYDRDQALGGNGSCHVLSRG